MPMAASQSRAWTRRGWEKAIMANTRTSSMAMSGWTRLRLPIRRAAIWNTNPRIMQRIPMNHSGRWIR